MIARTRIVRFSPLSIALAAVFVALMVLDMGLTHWAASQGMLREANPIMAYLIGQSWGLAWFAKVVAATGCALAFLFLARHRYIRLGFIGGIGAMTTVCLINLLTIVA